jgi:sulfatase maturation enzyme AslB (radical SAM superfamily)
MFTLRIIEEVRENESLPFEQVLENFELGIPYSKVKRGWTKEFEATIKDWPHEDSSSVECIVCGENGTNFFICANNPLRHYQYFIMTDSGKTFERL